MRDNALLGRSTILTHYCIELLGVDDSVATALKCSLVLCRYNYSCLSLATHFSVKSLLLPQETKQLKPIIYHIIVNCVFT